MKPLEVIFKAQPITVPAYIWPEDGSDEHKLPLSAFTTEGLDELVRQFRADLHEAAAKQLEEEQARAKRDGEDG